jgi:hypothetical protein
MSTPGAASVRLQWVAQGSGQGSSGADVLPRRTYAGHCVPLAGRMTHPRWFGTSWDRSAARTTADRRLPEEWSGRRKVRSARLLYRRVRAADRTPVFGPSAMRAWGGGGPGLGVAGRGQVAGGAVGWTVLYSIRQSSTSIRASSRVLNASTASSSSRSRLPKPPHGGSGTASRARCRKHWPITRLVLPDRGRSVLRDAGSCQGILGRERGRS